MAHYLVVGAASGIGRSVLQKLIGQGHTVTATYHTSTPEQLPGVNWYQVDVREEIQDTLIPAQLDGVVYCPGSIQLKPFHRIYHDDFIADYSLQVGGLIRVLQKAFPVLKQSPHAAVVTFSTVAVQRGFNFHSLVSASKGAIEGLTRALAAEWAPTIRVNSIAPSITDTPLASALLNTAEKREANAQRHPLKRIGTPEDIANAVVFLLSPQSAWMTGEILHIDGGMHSIK